MNATLSVIIPIYRAETTLDRCVRSVLSQEVCNAAGTHRDDAMEVLLVDDGSPDGCPALCDGWARSDRRVTVIHKPNGGLSDARNAGIAAATGDYITFIDADDYIAEGTFRSLTAILREHGDYGVLEYPAYRFYGSKRQSILTFADTVYTDADDYWFVAEAYTHSYACNKVFRRTLFDNVRFPVGKVFEDAYTLPEILAARPVVATTATGMYYYTYNPRGITATAGKDEWRMLLEAHVRVIERYLRAGKDTAAPLFQRYYMHVLNIQLSAASTPLLPFVRIRAPRRLPARMRVKCAAHNMLGTTRLCKIYNTLIHR